MKLGQHRTSCGITLKSADITHKVILDTLNEVLQDEITYGSDHHIQLAVDHTYAMYEAQRIIAKCEKDKEENVGLEFELNAIKLDLPKLDGLFLDMSPTSVGVGGNVNIDNGGDTSPQRQVRLHKSDDDDEEKKDDDEDGYIPVVVRTTPIPIGNYPDGIKTLFHSNGRKYEKFTTDCPLVIPPEDIMDIIATDLDFCRVEWKKEKNRGGFIDREYVKCRKITCTNRAKTEQFCKACYTSYLPDSEANKVRTSV